MKKEKLSENAKKLKSIFKNVEYSVFGFELPSEKEQQDMPKLEETDKEKTN